MTLKRRLNKCLELDIEDFDEIVANLDKFLSKASQTKVLLKSLVRIWSQDEDSKRISAFYVLTKVLTKKPDLFTYATKSLFMAFLKSATKGNPTAQGTTTFMIKCLVELYSLNLQEAYLQAFLFVRQNAISLKKAYSTAVKKDVRSVYNWQFINSLKLWTSLVSEKSQECEFISSLIHPLVNILVGTIRLVPSENWIPLRFHCIKMLHQLSGNLSLRDDSPVTQHCFVPTIPLLLDVVQLVNFNKKQNKISKSPFDLRLFLHFSKSLSNETGIKDAVVEWLHDLLFESLALNMNSLSFVELTVPMVYQIKQFLKLCKYPKGKDLFRNLIALVNQHSAFVSKHRSTIKNISDLRDVNIRINQLKMVESQFYIAFKKHTEERRQFLAKLTQLKLNSASHEELDQDDINKDFVSEEALKRKELLEKRKKRKSVDMEESDSDDVGSDDDDDSDKESIESYDIDDGNEVVHVTKEQAMKEAKKSKSRNEDDDNFNLFEALNAAAGDEDDAVSIATSVQDYEDDLLDDFELSDEEENGQGREGMDVDLDEDHEEDGPVVKGNGKKASNDLKESQMKKKNLKALKKKTKKMAAATNKKPGNALGVKNKKKNKNKS